MTTLLSYFAIFALGFAFGFWLRRIRREQQDIDNATKKWFESEYEKVKAGTWSPPLPVADANEFPTRNEIKERGDRLSKKALAMCHDPRCDAKARKWHKCHNLDCQEHFPKKK